MTVGNSMMSCPRVADARPAASFPAEVRWPVILVCLLPVLAITPQSFWIDEALTATTAAKPTLASAWQQLAADKNSDVQMPLYMLYAWGWAKFFGTGEWLLRAANLPWFLVGALAFAFSFRGPGRLFAALFAALSSFAWFYLDEARPYAMQLGASLLLAASIRRLADPLLPAESGARWTWGFALGIGILAGTSLLGVFWCGAAGLVLGGILGRRRVGGILRAGRFAWLVMALWLATLAGYYLWTMKIGARASAMGTTNLQNAFFIAYELLGFSGLGPGRLQIRESGLAAFRTHLLPLAVYGAFVGALLLAGWSSLWRQSRWRMVWVGGGVLATLVTLLTAGWVMHFRLLGRHCAPAQTAVLVLLVAGATEIAKRRGAGAKTILCGFLLISAAACFSARFAERHQKDDYRSAVADARTALDAGKTVWWSADPKAAGFYGLTFAPDTGAHAEALLLLNPTPETVGALPSPDVVVCSKPDLYDAHGALHSRLTREQFRKTAQRRAFSVWVRPL